MKVLVFQAHFAPYRDRTFSYLHSMYSVDFVFRTALKTHGHSEWEYTLPNVNNKYLGKNLTPKVLRGKIPEYYKGTLESIMSVNFDVCITSSWIICTIIKTFKRGKKVILMADTSRLGKNASKKSNYLFLRHIYNKFDSVFCPGIAAKEYFEYYCVPSNRIFMGSYTYDAKSISMKVEKIKEAKKQIRSGLGIKENAFVFLFIGKLIETRKIDNLLKAIELKQIIEPTFIIIGDGPDKDRVLEFKKQYTNIIYIDSVPLNDLEKYYGISDAYIHPGWEPYSLAVYEAAIAGLPIVSVKTVGATKDCIIDRKNGILIEENDIQGLAEAILSISNKEYDIEAVKDMATDICEHKGIPWAAKNLYDAMQQPIRR